MIKFLFKKVSIAPLVVLRLAFGSLLLFSTIRTGQKGWIDELYIQPSYHFGFFSWLEPLNGQGIYFVFLLLGISALCIVLGLFYRVNALVFCLLFTYVELLDKTYYLNHYYLVSLVTFWLAMVPAHRRYSLDVLIFPKIKSLQCANWHILIFKVQLSIVYFFAGLAKVNTDWLFNAQPMATWLPGKYQLPVIGQWMHFKETAFIFSWAGCAYDLTIWIFLWIKKTRSFAYFLVLVFHVLTAILFPRIGMFPFIMIISTVIFFSPFWHEKVLSYLPFNRTADSYANWGHELPKWKRLTSAVLIAYFVIQLYLPLRHLQYSGNLFWHEKGYRFSWRVMLMEKNGYTAIIIKDTVKNIQKEVSQDDYLTPFQQQQMKSQPDMILQFVKHIGDEFVKEHGYAPEIYVKSRLSLNGRRSQFFTNDTINVYSLPNLKEGDWILSLK